MTSSLGPAYFNDQLALELMHGSDLIALCPGGRYIPELRGKFLGDPYFASFEPYAPDRSLPGWSIQDMFRFAYHKYRVVFTAGVLNEHRERQVLVITEESYNFDDTPRLWGGIFQLDWDEWKTIVSPRFITDLGLHSWLGDSLDDRKLVQIGPSKYGVLLKGESGGQGETDTGAVLIAEVDNELKEVFSAHTGRDYYGGCNPDEIDDLCQAYESQIEFRECGDGDYWPIYLYTVGTDLADELPFPKLDISKVQTYEFRDGAYSLVNPPAPESITEAAGRPTAGSKCGATLATSEAPPAAWVVPTPSPAASGTDILSSQDRAAILDSCKRPEVIVLRKAMDAYASGHTSPYLDEFHLPRGFDSDLPFGTSFAGTFALLAEEPNLISGANLYIMPQDRSEKVFLAWMVKKGNTWTLRKIWEAAISPDMDKRRIAAYKLLLSDPELGF